MNGTFLSLLIVMKDRQRAIGLNFLQIQSTLTPRDELWTSSGNDFDCNLYHSHFCCLNRALNNRFEFIFCCVRRIISIETNSELHSLFLQCDDNFVGYSYINKQNHSTHIKIDVDGAEQLVINGAKVLLSNKTVRHIY